MPDQTDGAHIPVTIINATQTPFWHGTKLLAPDSQVVLTVPTADFKEHDFVIWKSQEQSKSYPIEFSITVKPSDLESNQIKIIQVAQDRYAVETLQTKPTWHRVRTLRRKH